MKVSLDLEKCISCGSCENVCSEVFKMDENMKIHLQGGTKEGKVETKEVESNCLREAADICPVQAITVE